MSDFSYLSNIIGETRREFTTVDVLRHLDEGGTLTEEQRDRAETLNNYATNAMDGLISGLEGLGSMMFYAAMHDKDGLERIDAANTAWLVFHPWRSDSGRVPPGVRYEDRSSEV